MWKKGFKLCEKIYLEQGLICPLTLWLALKDIVTPRSQYSALRRENGLRFSTRSLNTHSCGANFVRMLRIPGHTRGDVFGFFFCTMQSWISVFNIRYSDLKIVFAGPNSQIWVSKIRYIRGTWVLRIWASHPTSAPLGTMGMPGL